jgi:hypothetical protein
MIQLGRKLMPLYMDRHDVPGVTAEQVAQAHAADIAIEHSFGVQFLLPCESAHRRRTDGRPPADPRLDPERDHQRLGE